MIPKDLEHLAQDAWDRGVDPLDEASVVSWLDEHPEHIEAFAAWRASVETLPSMDAASTRRHRPLVAALAAATLLAGSLVVLADDRCEPPSPEPGFRTSTTTEASSLTYTVSWRERRTLAASPNTQLTITEHRSARR